MDRYSGAGFTTKRSYGSGFFQMRIKAPRRNSAGVVTAFYLTSVGEAHDELDFEILGNEESRPIRLNTNIFIDGYGNREKTVHLSWFDPTADFHNYTLLWNHRQIVFFVDEVPVRVMRKVDGKSYPATRPMWLQASLWNGEPWAMDTDQKKINWAYGPFRAYFKDFKVDGCPVDGEGSDLASCSSPEYWWNAERYWKLDEAQQMAYEHVLEHYQTADYCIDRPHPPECGL
ncbi:unnamed protein product [Linum tenue]|uniref:GH16 domain-containing protein n=1 Tax=Linum tenue TaxID=586396 RepID=A0AAV0KFN4_9ROSI|nr:unnamed protein product [Linum tenue]